MATYFRHSITSTHSLLFNALDSGKLLHVLNISSAVRNIEGAATSAITARARLLTAAGRDVIEMARGEPYFDTPEHIKRAAMAAIADGQTKYTPTDGTIALKDAIREKFHRENGLRYEREEITVGSGCKQVLHNALMATLSPNDQVIIPTPCWDCYAAMTRLAGGEPVFVSCHPETGFRLMPADLERAITPRTRWVILNIPNNPTGVTYSSGELVALMGVIKSHPDVWLLSDEIYEQIVFEIPLTSALAVEPALRTRTLIVNGVSKTYAMTGFRIGYGAAPAELIKAIAKIQSNTTSNPCSISQAAAVEALNGPQGIVKQRVAEVRECRDVAVKMLNASPNLSCVTPQGAFFAFTDCSRTFNKRTPDNRLIRSDTDFVESLLEAEAVAVTYGSAFGQNAYFRLTYGVPMTLLREACARIQRFCRSLTV